VIQTCLGAVIDLFIRSGPVLEKVCEYLYYVDKYAGQSSVPDMEIPPEMSLELALAADFLECMLQH
jgi:hypothetical protein